MLKIIREKPLESLVVAVPVISGLSFLVSYFFELGYLSAFGVPTVFAQVKTENFLFSGFILSILLMIILSIYDITTKSIDAKGKMGWPEISILLLFYLCVIIVSPPIISVTFLGLTISAALSFLIRRKHHPVRQTKSTGKPSWYKIVTILYVSFIALVGLAYFTGSVFASFGESYATFNKNKNEYLIVRSYGDKHLIVQYNEAANLGPYEIYNDNALAGIEITNKSKPNIEINNTATNIRSFFEEILQ